MNINKLLETIKDTSRDYVGMNGCLYQDITREELDLIVNEIERLNNIINEVADEILKELNENHHLSYGVALALRQKLISYKEIKGSDKE